MQEFFMKKMGSGDVLWSSDYSADDSDYNSQDESNSNASIITNATETEQNISDNELTGENLIIDENTDNNHEHEHSLACSCSLDIQNSNSKNNEQTPNNKETNNKGLPDTMQLKNFTIKDFFIIIACVHMLFLCYFIKVPYRCFCKKVLHDFLINLINAFDQ